MAEGSKTSPTDARTYYQKGNMQYEKGNYDKAVENYNMAVILNPSFSEAYFNRGLCYYNLKNFDKSITDYAKAAELDPKNPVIYNNRGDAFYRKQDFDNAIKDYDKAIALNPRYLKACYNRGLAFACQQDYEKAVQDFNTVIELNPNFAEAYHIRGLAFDYLNDFDKAIADYDKAIELNPNFTEAINHREIAKSKKDAGMTSGGGPDTALSGAPGGQQQQTQGINAVKLLTKPTMTFTDVAGMVKMKEDINEAIVYPFINPELARHYGKLAGGGIMLYGPPGCGKTFIVKAAAGECKASFINAKISDILDMYVGNTEKNLHNIFETGRKNSPCVVFFDEMEAMGGRREDMGQSNAYMKMAVNQLLYEMDGVEATNVNVLIIGATNAPWDVDPALRRSGRFGKTIYIPEPDYNSRRDILKMHARRLPCEGGIVFNRLARCTLGYASADLKAVVEEAAAIPWRQVFHKVEKRKIEYMKQGMAEKEAEEKATKEIKQRKINMGDFLKAIKKKKSSLPPWYEQAKKQIGQQEEKTVVDGKEHIKITESKLAVAEKDSFKDLLDIIKRRNEWWYKGYVWAWKNANLYLPLPL